MLRSAMTSLDYGKLWLALDCTISSVKFIKFWCQHTPTLIIWCSKMLFSICSPIRTYETQMTGTKNGMKCSPKITIQCRTENAQFTQFINRYCIILKTLVTVNYSSTKSQLTLLVLSAHLWCLRCFDLYGFFFLTVVWLSPKNSLLL